MKVHGVQEYILWHDDEDGGYALLIKGDPPSRHLLTEPRMLHSFHASSYHEARVKQHEYLGWSTPTMDDFDYPPEEYLT